MITILRNDLERQGVFMLRDIIETHAGDLGLFPEEIPTSTLITLATLAAKGKGEAVQYVLGKAIVFTEGE